MEDIASIHFETDARHRTDKRLQQMHDYATVGKELFRQRQIIFAAALFLASFYYSLFYSLVTCAMIVVSESYDFVVFRKILKVKSAGEKQIRWMMASIYLGTIASAGTIAFYAAWISQVQESGTHFMALFFLFAAALFAAMNNHQLPSVLVLRLFIYGITFISIPIWDIVRTNAEIHSKYWAQLFSSVFVVYFIVDCSRIFLNFYRLAKKQMADLNVEHEATKRALRVKSDFLSTMSHELRTPLTAIKASIDMAHSGNLGLIPDKVKSVLSVAQRNCTQLVSLINEVLDLQKMESGKMSLNFSDCAVADLLQDAVDQNQPFAQNFKTALKVQPLSEAAHVTCDKARLMQVLANMLSNAVKFSPSGSEVTIKAEVDRHSVRILVVDQGRGLAEEDHDLVFDRFSQLISTDSRKIEGTGLGMNISKHIIDAHGGIIGYYKNTGPGTTFFFELDRLYPAVSTEPRTNPLGGNEPGVAAE